MRLSRAARRGVLAGALGLPLLLAMTCSVAGSATIRAAGASGLQHAAAAVHRVGFSGADPAAPGLIRQIATDLGGPPQPDSPSASEQSDDKAPNKSSGQKAPPRSEEDKPPTQQDDAAGQQGTKAEEGKTGGTGGAAGQAKPPDQARPGKPPKLPAPPASAPKPSAEGKPAGEGQQEEVKSEPGKVANGGFEQGLAGWTSVPGEGDYVRVDGRSSKSGKKALLLWAPRGGINPLVAQDVKLPGKAGWVTVKMQVRSTLARLARLVVRLELLGANNSLLRRCYLQRIVTDPRSWVGLTARLPVAADAERLRMTLRLVGSGGAWLDDVSLQVDPTQLLVLPRRLGTVEGKQQAVILRLLAAPQGELVVQTAEGKKVAARRQGQELAIDLPPLQAGRTELVVKADKLEDHVELWIAPSHRKPQMLSEDGWWQQAGGKQGLSIIFHSHPAESPAIFEQGFTAAEVLAPQDRDAMKKFLRSLAKQSIPLIMPLPFAVKEREREQVMKRFFEGLAEASHDRRVAGWIVADEPELRLEADAPQRYLEAKRLDGLHPMLVTMAEMRELELWRHFADGIFINFAGRPVGPVQIAERVRQVRASLQPWQPVGAILGVGWMAGGPQADETKLRLESFAALAAGAHALGWYCMHATGWDLQGTPVWPKFRGINDDIEKVWRAVIGWTEAKDVAVEPGGLVVGAWAKGPQRLVVLVNPARSDKAVHLTLTGKGAPTASRASLLTGSAQLTLAAGGVKLTVPAQSSLAFELTTGNPQTSASSTSPEAQGKKSQGGSSPAQPAGAQGDRSSNQGPSQGGEARPAAGQAADNKPESAGSGASAKPEAETPGGTGGDSPPRPQREEKPRN